MRTSLSILFSILSCTASLALADPPDHAPAHGYRHHHEKHEHKRHDDRYYQGYAGHRWERDYGVTRGNCNRQEIGAVLGGVTGAVIGSQVGKGDNRPVATVIGAVAGAVIGGAIGKDMDRSDESCVAQSLELARDGQHVRWTGANGRRYSMVSTRVRARPDGPCRTYTITDGRKSTQQTACQVGQGEWKVMC
jgi:outer membrane lipoprotein SlyB